MVAQGWEGSWLWANAGEKLNEDFGLHKMEAMEEGRGVHHSSLGWLISGGDCVSLLLSFFLLHSMLSYEHMHAILFPFRSADVVRAVAGQGLQLVPLQHHLLLVAPAKCGHCWARRCCCRCAAPRCAGPGGQ